MQHADAGQSRFADLGSADEVEVAVGIEPLLALRDFGDAQPAASAAELCAFLTMMAEIGPCDGMIHEARRRQIWIVRADLLD